jgi:acyl carrier protein
MVSGASITETDVLEAIREIATRELQIRRELLPSHELIGDLELDSIKLVTMLASIENRFRVCLEPADAGSIRTVQDIVEQVLQRSGESRP